MRRGKKNPGLHMHHEGPCTDNSTHGPTAAKEFALEQTGEDLLVDENGEHRGDDVAMFLSLPTSDGDSKGANRIIRRQAEIIGEEALGQLEQAPCNNHCGKNLTKSFCTLKKKETSFGGVGGLENGRIGALLHDVKHHLKMLRKETWVEGLEPTEAQVAETEKCIMNVIAHHCGDHSGCKDEDICPCPVLVLVVKFILKLGAG
jgi:hypothetical protein